MISMKNIMIQDKVFTRPMHLNDLFLSLETIATHMIENGWTVLPSQGKIPNLIKWKGVDKEELNAKTIDLIRAKQATSINVLMDDIDVYAIDIDFPSYKFTEKFVSSFKARTGLNTLYTVRGSKGLKIFLRIQATKKLPTIICPKVMIKERAWTEALKHEVELKHQLSTVAGLYPGTDCLYDEYPLTVSIVTAKISDLPIFDEKIIDLVKVIFKETLESKAFSKEFIVPFNYTEFEQKLYVLFALVQLLKLKDNMSQFSDLISFLSEAQEHELIKHVWYFDSEKPKALTEQEERLRALELKILNIKDITKLELIAKDTKRYFKDTIKRLNYEISKTHRYCDNILELMRIVECYRLDKKLMAA